MGKCSKKCSDKGKGGKCKKTVKKSHKSSKKHHFKVKEDIHEPRLKIHNKQVLKPHIKVSHRHHVKPKVDVYNDIKVKPEVEFERGLRFKPKVRVHNKVCWEKIKTCHKRKDRC